jgi:hypothetical protein
LHDAVREARRVEAHARVVDQGVELRREDDALLDDRLHAR